ncbi:unnamed protein product, partial [Protopolystoma xenopodis]
PSRVSVVQREAILNFIVCRFPHIPAAYDLLCIIIDEAASSIYSPIADQKSLFSVKTTSYISASDISTYSPIPRDYDSLTNICRSDNDLQTALNIDEQNRISSKFSLISANCGPITLNTYPVSESTVDKADLDYEQQPVGTIFTTDSDNNTESGFSIPYRSGQNSRINKNIELQNSGSPLGLAQGTQWIADYEAAERWRSASTQILRNLLPQLARGTARIDSRQALDALLRVFARLSGHWSVPSPENDSEFGKTKDSSKKKHLLQSRNQHCVRLRPSLCIFPQKDTRASVIPSADLYSPDSTEHPLEATGSEVEAMKPSKHKKAHDIYEDEAKGKRDGENNKEAKTAQSEQKCDMRKGYLEKLLVTDNPPEKKEEYCKDEDRDELTDDSDALDEAELHECLSPAVPDEEADLEDGAATKYVSCTQYQGPSPSQSWTLDSLLTRVVDIMLMDPLRSSPPVQTNGVSYVIFLIQISKEMSLA